MKKTLLILALTAAAAVPVLAEELAIGATAPNFALTNAVDGKTYSFKPGDGKISVVVFTCNQCPYAKAFEPRLIEISNQYKGKSVMFYLVNPNDESRFAEETMANMKARATSKGYPFVYLKDQDSSVAKAFGARVTPHVYVLDGKGVLRYRGYIDDSAKADERSRTGLTDALDALVAKRDVQTTETRAFGCTIKWRA